MNLEDKEVKILLRLLPERFLLVPRKLSTSYIQEKANRKKVSIFR